MRKRVFAVVIFCVAWAMLLSGCAPREGDPFAVMRGSFTAKVCGEVNGVTVEAVLEAQAAGEGTRAVTVTVYAPSGLSGTVLRRGEDGIVQVTVGDLAVTMPVGVDFSALLDLFPTDRAVTDITLDPSGRTTVNFAGGSIVLLSDGTPYAVCTSTANVRVVEFEKRE